MSKSSRKPVLTKAGIVLNADARQKLQALADWMEREQQGPQDPRVRLSFLGSVVTMVGEDITFVSPFGALVQMFEPFKLINANTISYRVRSVSKEKMTERVCRILGITDSEFRWLLRYIYDREHPTTTQTIITALRTLK